MSRLTKKEAIKLAYEYHKEATDGRMTATNRRMAREERDRLAKTYNITYGDVRKLIKK